MEADESLRIVWKMNRESSNINLCGVFFLPSFDLNPEGIVAMRMLKCVKTFEYDFYLGLFVTHWQRFPMREELEARSGAK